MTVSNALLAQKKDDILDRWFDLTLATYAPETAVLWKKQKDRFANPVAYRFKIGMEGVLNELVNTSETPTAAVFEPHLDEIVRVRAVQDFTPAQAVAFIYLLKQAARDVLWEEVSQNGRFTELFELESRIDVLALICLDIYCKCREKLFQLRINQINTQYSRLLKRAGLVCEIDPETPES
ncbi:RsbRD N-terminal domain-containing protein [Desulfolutivibrio sp.]|uniref:RsbRD N-terminal domain-containing protein n=1 Tax=Desulfolutivibrio sp. TaxID=2773296 RepID=UPI002F96A355